MNIVLIGMMGSGKSAVGKLLAKKLKWKYLDCDELIEKQERMTVSAIFQTKGEKVFRALEKKVVRRVAKKNRAVIATGGGAPCSPENRAALSQNGFVVWLRANPQVLFARLKKGGRTTRPLLSEAAFSPKLFAALLRKRRVHYQKADFIIDTDNRTVKEAADEIAQAHKFQMPQL